MSEREPAGDPAEATTGDRTAAPAATTAGDARPAGAAPSAPGPTASRAEGGDMSASPVQHPVQHPVRHPVRHPVQYDGRTFAPADGGAARGRYRQVEDLVWAAFSGGAVRSGHLVGRAGPDGVIHAAYCQLMAGGETVAGLCTSSPSVLADGRLRLTELWRRLDGTSGVSVIEEVVA